MNTTELIALTLLGLLMYLWLRRQRRSRRERFIRDYPFHPAIAHKLDDRYPQLNEQQKSMIFDALRDYFLFCHRAKRRMVAMPSQVVDVAWHEFILFTREYERFCRQALGRFLHHTPTEAMHTPTRAQQGIKRAWRLACAHERIDPKTPTRLPLLFAIDDLLDIENGFRYSLNCRDRTLPNSAAGYCAGHIGCASGCGGDSGSASGGGGWFDGFGGDGGGSSCGGSGCGGD